MKNIYFLFIGILIFFSCSKNKETNSDFIDKTLDLVIKYSNGQSIEYPDLYDKPVYNIADDKDEKLKLAERLKSRGFKIINWERGNNPPSGPRIVVLTLEKENCKCKVTKIYYSTISDSVYLTTEKINCIKMKN
ncbi:hypothetical protein [Flavobacterium salmonis]|uniref:Lipoprotein n=1 Tax=Flavobacterium salmonis TaxID=2654844 RepID=A0A6V6YR48_9FLAO|nr:hypothetical protein [Flavobacterium salmonis]CAD0001192.1 hypothetical protein FLAT13_00423 [Flavobacterium salmonis]